MENDITILLDYILEVAEAIDLTNEQLSEKAGFHRQQVSKWTARSGDPNLNNFIRLCKAAGVKIILKSDEVVRDCRVE